MVGFFTFCTIVIWLFIFAKNKNDAIKRKNRNRTETAARGSVADSSDNRALRSMREGDKAPAQMPIETRRRRQQQTADRSRIHQSLHSKEAKSAAAASVPQKTEAIRFDGNELMDEVFDIMVCGYPGSRSGQRDFLAEGAALLERYTL
ncbi:MAG: hypothetical protein IJ679_02505 [Lachnospiraceae bacterium]|nr:hypothetical protein [Lachnospiraceae bacterium]